MNTNAQLARRLREIRQDLYGEIGIEVLARAANVPTATWHNYEQGVTMPANVLLDFLEVTGTDPHWLLTGEGERLSVRTA
jgi:DNA-binding transcriptional regulator YiaG